MANQIRARILLLLSVLQLSYLSPTMAQDPAIIPKTKDSLRVFLQTYRPFDTVYVRAMRPYALKLIYEDDNLKAADSVASMQRKLAEKIKYGRGIYFSDLLKAIIASNETKPAEALAYFRKSYQTVVNYKMHPSLHEAALNNIAVAFEDLGKKDSALFYALKAMKIQEDHWAKIKEKDAGPYLMAGNILKEYKRNREAFKYYKKGLEIDSTKNNPIGMAIVLNKIGNLYDDQQKPSEALKYYEKGLIQANESGYKLLQTDLLSNMGRILQQLGKVRESEKYLLQNLQLCRTLNSETALQTALTNLGEFYISVKNYTKATTLLKEANDLVQKTGNLDQRTDMSHTMADLYGQLGNYQLAYDFQKLHTQLLDSLRDQESEYSSKELIEKYESDKKDAEIEVLHLKTKQATWQRNLWIVALAVMVVLTFVFVIYFRNRSKLKELEEKQNLRNRISADLHDEIGSTLSSISILSEMIGMQQGSAIMRPEIMRQISEDARNVIDKMDDIIWTINPENDAYENLETRLKSYAIPLMEAKNIDFVFDFDPGIQHQYLEMSNRRNIYLILKEAINNSLKYSQAKIITVSAKSENSNFIFSVTDDGKGFETQKASQRNGLKNMQKRAAQIGAELVIESKTDQGTKISLKTI